MVARYSARRAEPRARLQDAFGGRLALPRSAVCIACNNRLNVEIFLFRNHPRYAARSAGTEVGARIKVTAGHLGWADLVFCMEKKRADRLRERFPGELAGRRLITLRIPDDYGFMDPALIELLRAELGTHLEL